MCIIEKIFVIYLFFVFHSLLLFLFVLFCLYLFAYQSDYSTWAEFEKVVLRCLGVTCVVSVCRVWLLGVFAPGAPAMAARDDRPGATNLQNYLEKLLLFPN